MTKEKYETPIMEVVDLKDDVILTSGDGCPPVGICPDTCTPVGICSGDEHYQLGPNTWIYC